MAVHKVFFVVYMNSNVLILGSPYPLEYLRNIVEAVRKFPIGYLEARWSLIWFLKDERVLTGLYVKPKLKILSALFVTFPEQCRIRPWIHPSLPLWLSFCKYRFSSFIYTLHYSLVLVKLFLHHNVPLFWMVLSWMDDTHTQRNFTVHEYFYWWVTIRHVWISYGSVTTEKLFLICLVWFPYLCFWWVPF